MRTAFFSLLTMASAVNAFAPFSNHAVVTTELRVGYVPDGMTPEQWKKLQKSEQQTRAKQNFGAYGITRGFKSRSLQSFQTDLEQGKANHLMPMFNAKEKLRSGKIQSKDIPYMQRSGGSWDGEDVGKKKKWTAADKKYKQSSTGGFTASFNIGTVPRHGDKTTTSKPQSKKLFGMF